MSDLLSNLSKVNKQSWSNTAMTPFVNLCTQAMVPLTLSSSLTTRNQLFMMLWRDFGTQGSLSGRITVPAVTRFVLLTSWQAWNAPLMPILQHLCLSMLRIVMSVMLPSPRASRILAWHPRPQREVHLNSKDEESPTGALCQDTEWAERCLCWAFEVLLRWETFHHWLLQKCKEWSLDCCD